MRRFAKLFPADLCEPFYLRVWFASLALVVVIGSLSWAQAIDSVQVPDSNPPPQELEVLQTAPQKSTEAPLAQLESPPLDAPALPQLDAAQLEDIKNIRARLGGGVAEQFQGLTDDADPMGERLFDSELRRVAGLPANEPETSTTTSRLASSPSSMLGAPEIATLRSAARHLDSAAADLEDINLYGQADMIRKQAAELRKRARQ